MIKGLDPFQDEDRALSRWNTGGQRGIRTLGTFYRSYAFQAYPIDHSGICPLLKPLPVVAAGRDTAAWLGI